MRSPIPHTLRLLTLPLLLAGAAVGAADKPGAEYFTIQVVDKDTGRGVPLVELRTVNNLSYWTDSAGVAAVNEPGLNGERTFFSVKSHGYEYPKDGFGIRGVRLEVKPGQSARVELKRLNLAERLYRVTGEGIYRDSLLTGKTVTAPNPLLNAKVLGCDSVQTTLYQGRMFWMWGDTLKPDYPLGIFAMTGATSELPGKGGLDPAEGVNLRYFKDESGLARGMAPVPGEGPTWLDALVVLKEDGKERLYASYAKIRNSLEAYQRGLLRFNDEKGVFEPLAQFPLDAPVLPHGHPALRKENGKEYVYFGDPFPLTRVEARPDALRDLKQYETYTCLKPGSRLEKPMVDRDEAGKLRFQWRKDAPAVTPEAQEALIKNGALKREEGMFRFTDPDNGKPVVIHRGTVNWNAYRKQWVMVATEIGGTSMLGEVWYAEAESPLGPWERAKKIVTHERYSFYNPMHHPEFDQQGGKILYFEGTYTSGFSGNPEATPRYDYNQMMYRLDLSDPRLTARLAEPGRAADQRQTLPSP